MTIYDGYSTWKPGKFPAVLAIGDSWFWYPKNNLLEALARHPKLKDGYQHMVRLGANGALLSEYVDVDRRPGKFSRQLRQLLQPDPMQYFSVFAISGAGNDAVDYSLGLHSAEICEKASTAEECISEDGMSDLMRTLTQAMSVVMHEVMWAFAKQQRRPVVLLHGYDYPVPDGRPFTLAGIPFNGPWLAKAMNARSVPKDLELRKGITHILVERMNTAFQRYAQPADGIYFVDSRDTLNTGAGYKKDWANELHPTRAGFDRIVDRKWIPVLRQAGIARD